MIEHPTAFCVLLVDSDAPVARNSGAWQFFRQQRGWQRPNNVTDENAHLMVQVMESWFLSDRPTLREYYGSAFREASLPGSPQIEQIPKPDVLNGLRMATRHTKKGEYHKTKHGFDILAQISAEELVRVSPKAARLLKIVRDRTDL